MQKRLTIKAADTAADIKTDAYGILVSVCRVQSAGITPILSSLEKGLYNITSVSYTHLIRECIHEETPPRT